MGSGEAVGIKVEIRSIDDLTPYERNARTHSSEQVQQLVASIMEWGWTTPVLADADGIVAGHGRVMAAQQIYAVSGTIKLPSGESLPAGTVPVIDCTGWNEEQRRAYIIADNQLALNAGWDMPVLSQELDTLAHMEFNLELLGFDDEQLSRLLGGEEQEEEEEKEQEEEGMNNGMALAIVLTPQEMKLWRKAKEELGYSTDKAAFWKLVEDFMEELS